MADVIAGAGAGTAVIDAGAAAGAGDGAGAGRAGDGAGAGGAGGGAGDGSSAGVSESEGTDGAGAGDGAGASDGEVDGTEAAQDELGEIDGIETDGRKIDDATRKAIAALKKIDPASAKRVAENYFRMGGVMKEVGATTPSEAVNKVRQLAATVESLGGDEGITNLQSEVEDYRNEIKQFQAGDPALLDQLHTASADQFSTMIEQGLNLLAQKSPALFDKALVGSMVARLENSGMFSSVDSLLALIKDGKGQEAYDLTIQIQKWLAGAKGKAQKQVEIASQKNPEREALDRDRAKLDEDKREAYEGRVGSDVNRQNNSVTSKLVEPFFKDLKLGNEGRREFVNALNSRLWGKMKADLAFQRAAKALMAKGDEAKSSRFIHAKFAELLPTEFKTLRDAMYPNYTRGGTKTSADAGKKAGVAGDKTAAAATGAGPAYAGGRPDRDSVDWTRTNETLWISGRAFLKGKPDMVKFNWSEVK